ncbi:YcaO-like family protein [Mycoavidus sp. B2-EB]|uniref:YcaO-like family protein n=1 Tax=Mycoavidus sp. B2-EB TaxID=2651972 RepID=UPI00162A784A|nr:YcaO-like family protein [Mycoavidus sp. B2-EB]BBO59505.1 hypothetical protein MPB2EB_0624 [Mycoavidus sp. B2-EB]
MQIDKTLYAALPDDLNGLLERLVHPRWGVLRQLKLLPMSANFPAFYHIHALLSDPIQLRLRNSPQAYEQRMYLGTDFRGMGFDTNLVDALHCCLGEAVERYCAALYREQDLLLAAGCELAGASELIERMILFSGPSYEQIGFPFKPYDDKQPRRWLEGYNWTLDQTAYVPAQLVLMGYEVMHKHETLLHTNSNGQGAGLDFAQATLSALCELVERDAFICYWLTRTPPIALQPTQAWIEAQPASLRALLANRELEVLIRLLPTDLGIPVVLAAIRPRGQRFACFGASCRLDLATAVRKAVTEAAHVWSYWHEPSLTFQPPKRAADIRSFFDHAAFYFDPKNYDNIAFLLDSTDSVHVLNELSSPIGVAAQLSELKTKIERAGYPILLFNLNSEECLAEGYQVVKAVVPGLHPIFSGVHRVDDKRRLQRVCAYLGVEVPERLNEAPHPFP